MGVGLPHVYTMQGTVQIKALLDHVQKDIMVGNFIHMELEAANLEVGIRDNTKDTAFFLKLTAGLNLFGDFALQMTSSCKDFIPDLGCIELMIFSAVRYSQKPNHYQLIAAVCTCNTF